MSIDIVENQIANQHLFRCTRCGNKWVLQGASLEELRRGTCKACFGEGSSGSAQKNGVIVNQLLTLEQVAAEKGITTQNVYRLVTQGILNCHGHSDSIIKDEMYVAYSKADAPEEKPRFIDHLSKLLDKIYQGRPVSKAVASDYAEEFLLGYTEEFRKNQVPQLLLSMMVWYIADRDSWPTPIIGVDMAQGGTEYTVVAEGGSCSWAVKQRANQSDNVEESPTETATPEKDTVPVDADEEQEQRFADDLCLLIHSVSSGCAILTRIQSMLRATRFIRGRTEKFLHASASVFILAGVLQGISESYTTTMEQAKEVAEGVLDVYLAQAKTTVACLETDIEKDTSEKPCKVPWAEKDTQGKLHSQFIAIMYEVEKATEDVDISENQAYSRVTCYADMCGVTLPADLKKWMADQFVMLSTLPQNKAVEIYKEAKYIHRTIQNWGNGDKKSVSGGDIFRDADKLVYLVIQMVDKHIDFSHAKAIAEKYVGGCRSDSSEFVIGNIAMQIHLISKQDTIESGQEARLLEQVLKILQHQEPAPENEEKLEEVSDLQDGIEEWKELLGTGEAVVFAKIKSKLQAHILRIIKLEEENATNRRHFTKLETRIGELSTLYAKSVV